MHRNFTFMGFVPATVPSGTQKENQMTTSTTMQRSLVAIAMLGMAGTVQAADFKWNQTASGTYDWSTTTNWQSGNAPVGSTHSDKIYFLDGSTLADGVTVTANNDIANPVLTQDIRFMGTGPGTGAATFNITGDPIKIGTGDRFVRLLANNGSGGTLTYNIYSDIQGTNAIQFINNGTATYNVHGSITPGVDGSGGVSMNGASTIRLHASQSFNNREFNHQQGTVELVGGANLTSNLRFLLRGSTLAVSGGNSTVNVLENLPGIGTLNIETGRVLNITTAQAVSNLVNEDANRIRVAGGGTLRATHETTVANFTAPLHLEGSTLELTRNNNWNVNQAIYLQDGGKLATVGFDNAFARLELRGGSSVIDLGVAGTSQLTFGDSSSVAWTLGSLLTIENWQGEFDPTDTDAEFLRFAGITADQVAQIQFLNPDGFAPGLYGAQAVNVDSFSYIVPIPEPTSAMVLLGLSALVMGRRRRRDA
jgi:hypothetical protein